MRRLRAPRIWLVGGALVATLLVALSWLMLIGPKLSEAHDLYAQSAASRQQNDVLRAKTSSLKSKSTKVTRYTSALKAALASLPYDSGLPAFTRQLSSQGKANDVNVTSVVVGGVTPVVSAAPVEGATGTAPTTAAPATTDTQGAFSLAVTVESRGSLKNQLAFLRTVRTVGPRQVLITATQISPGTGAKESSVDRAAILATQLTIFVAPQSPTRIRQLNKLASGDLER